MANQGLGTSPQAIAQSSTLGQGDGNIPGQQPKVILFVEFLIGATHRAFSVPPVRVGSGLCIVPNSIFAPVPENCNSTLPLEDLGAWEAWCKRLATACPARR